ncbi:hypothetical protein [Thalassotalea sp. PP2-459]|uniref:hypothetical protein n=1 Tax=Thalassotalea sp. PP2-459 TaxID=1742724 RepID=UPI0020C9FB57|nr:hypothetical protein [Thalassotalea sp. PP2-459]
MSTVSTISGTQIIDGIEYNEYPAPDSLIKAMESVWAMQLIAQGNIRLSPLSYYQNLESDELGDNLEGLGELQINSHPYATSSINEIFVWCCANPETEFSRLLSLDNAYDVIIQITNPVEFVNRISTALRDNNYRFSHPHVGRVNYNRSDEVTIDRLQEQMWHWNTFQKSASYEHQNEFRIVLSDLSFTLARGEAINLSIGNCEDIIELIET